MDTPAVLPRHHAPGGWRRVVVGLTLGAALGAVFSQVLPHDPGRWWEMLHRGGPR